MAISTIQQASLASGVPSSVASSALPAGTVLQVVSTNYETAVSTTSASYVTTGLTTTITPKFATSKILATVNMLVYNSASSGQSIITIFRGTVSGTDLGAPSGNGFGGCFMNGATEVFSVASGSVLDSPATTSATTYTVALKRKTAGIAYTLVDNQRATLLGTKTFGKGLVQSVRPLGDGSGLAVTIAKYLTPNGTDTIEEEVPVTAARLNCPECGQPAVEFNEEYIGCSYFREGDWKYGHGSGRNLGGQFGAVLGDDIDGVNWHGLPLTGCHHRSTDD